MNTLIYNLKIQDGGAHNRRSGFSLSRQNGVFMFFCLVTRNVFVHIRLVYLS